MALVADLFGESVVDPFGFDLTERGVSLLVGIVSSAESERGANNSEESDSRLDGSVGRSPEGRRAG